MKASIPTFSPPNTPQIVKHVLIWTLFLSLCGALIDSMLKPWLGPFGMQFYLSISKLTFSKLYLWQPVTYLFVQQPFGGISFGFLFSLLFQLFVIWVMGSQIAERYGKKAFAALYFGSGIAAALLCLTLSIGPFNTSVAGPTASLFAIFVVWAVMMQDATVLAFFILPISVKYVLAIVLGSSFLINLSQWDLTGLIFLFTGTLFGYVYVTAFKELKTPFTFMHPLDEWMSNLKNRFDKNSAPKVVDINTGKKPLSDDDFVDQMLEKISKKGKDALTSQEKRRLDQISKRKF